MAGADLAADRIVWVATVALILFSAVLATMLWLNV